MKPFTPVELKNQFLSRLDLHQYSDAKLPELIVISFIAGVGVGKSYLAEKLSAELGLPIFDNDSIRRWLNRRGVSGDHPMQDLVLDIARSRRDLILVNHVSYVLDADLTLTYKDDVKVISGHGGHLLFVKLDYTPDLALQRIKARRQKGGSMSSADQSFFKLREEIRSRVVVNDDDIFFHFDCMREFAPQFDALVEKIRQFETDSV